MKSGLFLLNPVDIDLGGIGIVRAHLAHDRALELVLAKEAIGLHKGGDCPGSGQRGGLFCGRRPCGLDIARDFNSNAGDVI